MHLPALSNKAPPILPATGSRLADRSRDIGLLFWRSQAESLGEASRCRDNELRRMDEGEKLQQVQTGQIGIAEPLSQKRRIEQDMRRFRNPADRLAFADRAGFAIARADPDAAMAGMKRWIGERLGHLAGDDRYASDPRMEKHQYRI